MTQPHYFKLRVYYEDTDAGGVVYHANYLKFVERARTELLRKAGANQTDLRLHDELIFVVGHMDCKFVKPAFLDDELLIETLMPKVGKVSFTFEQKVWRDTELLFTTSVKAGSIDAKTFKPKVMPLELLEKLKQY